MALIQCPVNGSIRYMDKISFWMMEDIMDYTKLSCEEFVEILASKEPVPGGGGASALVGAIGTALGNMVGSLTLGKKKYADVQEDIIELKKKADALQQDFLQLVEQDALGFEPLSRAYGLPKETEEQKAEKDRVMEEALRTASEVPVKIMEKVCEAIELHKEFAAKGTAIAISDVGVGVKFCAAALQGASLNVYINSKLMKDKEFAERLNKSTDDMVAKYVPMADAIYNDVLGRLK